MSVTFPFLDLDKIALIWIVIALLLIPVQILIVAPYGRHEKATWGPRIGNRSGWIVMEVVSPVAFVAALVWAHARRLNISYWQAVEMTVELEHIGLILVFLWLLHYTNRAFVYPLRTRTSGKFIPVAIVLFAIIFNSVNGVLNGLAIGLGFFPRHWTPLMTVGLVVFFVGFMINQVADSMLINLRKPGEKGYKIPQGFLFQYISCPNHFGEILEWVGFALIALNVPAISFACWTAANLIPRALAHHRWYRKHFSDYPEERRAVIPFIL